MKAMIEATLTAIVVTTTILIGVLGPAIVMKNTFNSEQDFTYETERGQYALLALMSKSTSSSLSSYQDLGMSYVTGKTIDSELKSAFDKLIENDYCVSIKSEPDKIILTNSKSNQCPKPEAQFNTILVLPYNEKELAKILSIVISP